MLLSMTGYGRLVVELPDRKVNIEIRSLNSKAMDLSLRIASRYRSREMEIRQMVASALERGKVDMNLWVEGKDSPEGLTPPSSAALGAYYRSLSQAARENGIPEPADWMTLLANLPGIFPQRQETDEADAGEWEAVKKGCQQAIGLLMDFRRQEGGALEAKFREKIAAIASFLAQVEPYEKERVQKIRERLEDSLRQIREVDYDRGRLEQEMIYYIEKLDISEEKQRLRNHLEYFIRTLEGPQGQGKKLGFIAQEMGREINTLGSKSNQAEMQNLVVHMKDELEQIKEQVLNAM